MTSPGVTTTEGTHTMTDQTSGGDLIDATEMLESLTGFDEDEIETTYGADVFSLAEAGGTKYLRALLYVARRRSGLDKAPAKKAVQALSIRQVQDSFSDEPSDPEPPMPGEEPTTEAGKDDVEPD